jgi:hypothetical protein
VMLPFLRKDAAKILMGQIWIFNSVHIRGTFELSFPASLATSLEFCMSHLAIISRSNTSCIIN